VLASEGFLPIAYDNLVNGHEWAVQWGPFERGDLFDSNRLLEVLQRYRPSAVIHFAAYAYVGESVSDPGKYYRNNVAGSLSLLDAMCTVGLKRFVLSSTCATYGVPSTVPIEESHVQSPVNPYGQSKLMVEQILRDFGQAHGLHSVSLRYFNAAGADPDVDIGEDHDPETHLVPLVLRAASDPTCPVTVFGVDYPTPDGTCIRDYVHVEDLAKAHVLALHTLERQQGFSAFNLGTGRGHSVREVIDAAKQVTGREVAFLEGPRRPGDPPVLVASPTRARAELGWCPKWTNIHDIIRTAWQWHEHRMR
jgi:UDP-glucose-4-epimerase GalE